MEAYSVKQIQELTNIGELIPVCELDNLGEMCFTGSFVFNGEEETKYKLVPDEYSDKYFLKAI